MTFEEALALANSNIEKSDYRLEQLPKALQNLYLIDSLNYEVSNGGIKQWLYNLSGGYADETHNALEEIGATSIAALLLEVIRGFPDQIVPRSEMLRRKLVQRLELEMNDRWRSIGDNILAWPDDIDNLLRRYVNYQNDQGNI